MTAVPHIPEDRPNPYDLGLTRESFAEVTGIKKVLMILVRKNYPTDWIEENIFRIRRTPDERGRLNGRVSHGEVIDWVFMDFHPPESPVVKIGKTPKRHGNEWYTWKQKLEKIGVPEGYETAGEAARFASKQELEQWENASARHNEKLSE